MFKFLKKMFHREKQTEQREDDKSFSKLFESSILDFINRPIYKELTVNIFDSIKDEDIEQVVIDNLIAKMRTDMRDEFEVVMKFSKYRQAIYVIWQLEGQVNNGGFNQFYYNSSGQFANLVEQAYEIIGANKYAELVKRANEIFIKNKHQIIKQWNSSLEGFSKSYSNNPLNDFDNEFYDLSKKEDLSGLKISFIRNNKNYFIDK